VGFRGDAAFARPEIHEAHEAPRVKYAIRLPANDNVERKIREVPKRPVAGPATDRWCASTTSAAPPSNGSRRASRRSR
jgi:hypothetical protein